MSASDAALETCLDGLALARDLSYGNALIGSMVSSTSHGFLFFPCAEAIDRASPGIRQRAEVALRDASARAWPPSPRNDAPDAGAFAMSWDGG